MAFAPVFGRVFPASFDRGAAVAAAAGWWVVPGKTCVAAYQPLGAASLAASYTNLANPGTNDAAPGDAPSFASGTGWAFDGISQYLDSGVTDHPNGSYTYLVRFSDASSLSCLFGWYGSGAAVALFCDPSEGMSGYNGYDYPAGTFSASPGLVAGVYGFAGKTLYRNGAPDGSIPAGSGDAGYTCHIGALNFSVKYYFTGSIQAFGIYSDTLTAGEVATVSAAMAALTG